MSTVSNKIDGAFVRLEGSTLPYGMYLEDWLMYATNENASPKMRIANARARFRNQEKDFSTPKVIDIIVRDNFREGGVFDTVALTLTWNAPTAAVIPVLGHVLAYHARWQEYSALSANDAVPTVLSEKEREALKNAFKSLEEYGRAFSVISGELQEDAYLLYAPPHTLRRFILVMTFGELVRMWRKYKDTDTLTEEFIRLSVVEALRLSSKREVLEVAITTGVKEKLLAKMLGIVRLPSGNLKERLVEEFVEEFEKENGVVLPQSAIDAVERLIEELAVVDWGDAVARLYDELPEDDEESE